MARWLVITSIVALVQACAYKPWLNEARTGDLVNLQRYVEVASDRHQFNRSRARQLAEAVAEREIATADDHEAYRRLLRLKPCAGGLYFPLLHRSQRRDELAAAASLVLIDTGWLDGNERLRALAESADGAWRAVAARAANSAALRPRVYHAMLDPDLRVRSAALMTIEASPIRDDAKALLDAIRHDPDDSLRARALAALAEIGDIEALLLVREQWDTMSEQLRLAFLQALDAPWFRAQVGTELLWRTMDHDDSMLGVVAASLLLHGTGPVVQIAQGRLVRAMHHGSASEQLLALAALGGHAVEHLRDVLDLARDGSPFVRVAALEAWLRTGYDAMSARQRLATISRSKDADAAQATRTLALQGDPDALARLETLVTLPHADERMGVARLLMQLKRWDAVARLLVDDHPAVRLEVACQLLAD